MFRKLLMVLGVALLLAACQGSDTAVEETPAVAVTIEEFNANPENYVGLTLAVTGTVNHVCRHSGKKMFIMGEDPDQHLKIDAGESIGVFAVELEGSNVAVEGVVQVLKVDEAYLNEWEAEVLAAADGVDVTEGEDAVGACAAEREYRAGADDSTAEVEETATEVATTVSSEGKDDHHNTNPDLEQINALRQELAASGDDYLGFYSLEGNSFEELK